MLLGGEGSQQSVALHTHRSMEDPRGYRPAGEVAMVRGKLTEAEAVRREKTDSGPKGPAEMDAAVRAKENGL